MGRFEKHLGKGEPIVIDGEEYVLKPLGTEFIPDFFRAMKAFSGASEGATPSQILANLDDEGLTAIQNIIEETLKKSFPDEWITSQDELKAFGLKYMHILISRIFEMNTAVPEEVGTIKKIRTLKKIQKKVDDKGNTGTAEK